MDKLTEYLKAERGRLSALAKAIGVTPGAINQWEGKVPAERMGDVSRATGISVHDLRPDIFHAAKKVRKPRQIEAAQ
jgi:DNA-binding transcriptional regulator YdaS (Cro superfamily)